MAFKSYKNAFRPRRTVVACGAVALFLMGALFGSMASLTLEEKTLYSADRPNYSPAPDNSEDAHTVSIERIPAQVLSSTEVEWITSFKACGHESVEKDSKSAVGMTVEKLKEIYADYEVRMFTAEKVKLKRELDGYCPQHYVVLLEEGRVCVKRTDPDKFLPYKVMELSISAEILDADIREELENGIAFNSLEEINAYFEGVEG